VGDVTPESPQLRQNRARVTVRTKLKVEGSSEGCGFREEQGDQPTRSGAKGSCQPEVDESGEVQEPNGSRWRESVRYRGSKPSAKIVGLGSGDNDEGSFPEACETTSLQRSALQYP
jgi:hypothetical protein